jgi:hypothetical protein
VPKLIYYPVVTPTSEYSLEGTYNGRISLSVSHHGAHVIPYTPTTHGVLGGALVGALGVPKGGPPKGVP